LRNSAVKSRARRRYLRKQANKTERILYYIQLAFVSLINIVVVLVTFTFFFRNSIVDGNSMQPTFENKDQNILRKFGKVKRFDIIVFNPPKGYAGINENDHFIKRVIGLPGDEIAFKDNKLYINGKLYEEPFLKDINGEKNLTYDFKLDGLSSTNRQKTVPPDSYFVMGDNRAHSSDSRYFGFVKSERISGIVFFRFSPILKFRFF
jgi:signal peptidase I